MDNWIVEPLSTLIIVVFPVLPIFSIIILITRISGLRTFAKMSSFDFATTIAIGSILASAVINTGQSIVKGTVVWHNRFSDAVLLFEKKVEEAERPSDQHRNVDYERGQNYL